MRCPCMYHDAYMNARGGWGQWGAKAMRGRASSSSTICHLVNKHPAIYFVSILGAGPSRSCTSLDTIRDLEVLGHTVPAS